MPQPEFLSLREAARRFDVSLTTLHRRLKAGDLEALGAFKDHAGHWQIPPQALATLGYAPHNDGTPGTVPVTPPDTTWNTQMEQLERQLDEARQRAELAEAQRDAARELLAERERVVTVQAQALRMLESGTSHEPVPAGTPGTVPVTPPDTTPGTGQVRGQEAPRRRGFLSRFRRQ